jgi:tyrosinase
MGMVNSGTSRRHFIQTSVAAAATAALPFRFAGAQSGAKYTRHNVTSPAGKSALESYAKGIEAMLKLPADDPRNWFRNAFVHLMDCPHGNWWFYVWHRGYLGYFEETIRNLSGDDGFAMPYWDWTVFPQIPNQMFDGVLTPHAPAFEPYTRDLAVFTSFIQTALTKYWKSLTVDQRAQLKIRGYAQFDQLWNDVTGFDPHQATPHGVSGNMGYANPCGARYLTRDNPKLDDKTAYDVSAFVIYSGLLPTDFYNPVNSISFNSSKTPSHNTAPGGHDSFSVLEGLPHNKVHNYIGGVGPLDPGPYGNMTNFLSPVDPIFYLHHANIDRLWDVWTRKQERLKLPYLPQGQELKVFSSEPFLFYVDGRGNYVGASHAGDYVSMDKFEYDYEPGFGEKIVEPPSPALFQKHEMAPVQGSIKGNTAMLSLPSESVRSHLSEEAAASLFALITLPRPNALSSAREFDVIVGAPPDVTQVDANSPYYAGTIAFFGKMMNMNGMAADATFAVPLPRAPEAFHALGAARNVSVDIRVVASQGHGEKAPALKAATIRTM